MVLWNEEIIDVERGLVRASYSFHSSSAFSSQVFHVSVIQFDLFWVKMIWMKIRGK